MDNRVSEKIITASNTSRLIRRTTKNSNMTNSNSNKSMKKSAFMTKDKNFTLKKMSTHLFIQENPNDPQSQSQIPKILSKPSTDEVILSRKKTLIQQYNSTNLLQKSMTFKPKKGRNSQAEDTSKAAFSINLFVYSKLQKDQVVSCRPTQDKNSAVCFNSETACECA